MVKGSNTDDSLGGAGGNGEKRNRWATFVEKSMSSDNEETTTVTEEAEAFFEAMAVDEEASKALRGTSTNTVSAPLGTLCSATDIRRENAAGESVGTVGPPRKPRLKAPPPATSGDAQPAAAPDALLDPLSHTLSFLHDAKSLCHVGVVCKKLRRVAGLRLDRLIEEMNQKCDRHSVGEGGRTKLIRYQAAMDLVEKVRHGLEDHLSFDGPLDFGSNGTLPPLRMQAKCRGCSAFPQSIDNEFFFDNDEKYEVFICFFDFGESGSKFEGFVPMQDEGRTFIVGGNYGATPKWDEMRQFTSEPTDDNFVAIATSKLSIIAVAVRKSDCNALFLGAASDFTKSFPRALVLYDVHADSRSYPDPTGDRVTTTRFSLERALQRAFHVGSVAFRMWFFAPRILL